MMVFQPRRDKYKYNVVFQFQTLFSVLMITNLATDTDILCLRSIKDSLEDPYNYLSSWKFNNLTEGFICKFSGVECWHPDENRVLNLRLSDMGLKGEFPRGIKNCTSLTGLDLSNNHLSGSIPSDISTLLPYVTTVDLSSNRFSGEIPTSLANCSYLNSLKLDNNVLSGQIPKQLGYHLRLKTMTVSYNLLSGAVPEFNASVLVNYAHNSGLCGGSLPPCSLGNGRSEFRESFKDGLIVGYVASFISFVAYASYYLYSLKPCTSQQLKQSKSNHTNKAAKYIRSITRWNIRTILPAHMDRLLSPKILAKGTNQISLLLERMSSRWSLEELNDATDCFNMDNAIGIGKMGLMYQGALPNGQYLAVKRVSNSQLFKSQFLSEIMILSECRHKNVIRLLGFCNEREENILVYQYMPNGRLSKWLHPLESEVVRLKWPQRIHIAIGIASGLSWLHQFCKFQIVHLNICSECILLDENFEPKISNFGEAKFMNSETEDGLGTNTMLKVNEWKKDVYDFGSVLFELITGQTYDEIISGSSSIITNLCDDPSNFYDAIDKSVFGEASENEVFTLIKVACECVQPIPDQRPTMLQVYNNVRNIRKGRHEFIIDNSHMPRASEIIPLSNVDEIVEL